MEKFNLYTKASLETGCGRRHAENQTWRRCYSCEDVNSVVERLSAADASMNERKEDDQAQKHKAKKLPPTHLRSREKRAGFFSKSFLLNSNVQMWSMVNPKILERCGITETCWILDDPASKIKYLEIGQIVMRVILAFHVEYFCWLVKEIPKTLSESRTNGKVEVRGTKLQLLATV